MSIAPAAYSDSGKGGDMKNPTCKGMEEGSTRSLPESIETYNILNRCLKCIFFFKSNPSCSQLSREGVRELHSASESC